MGSMLWYTTLEAVKSALDIQETARNNAQVRRAIEAASRTIDGARVGQGHLGRRFYPETLTRTFDAPAGCHLDLGEYELISVSTITCGGVVLAPDSYTLQPENDGPPYDQIDLNPLVYTQWPYSTTRERAIVIDGVWGYRADEEPIGTLSAQLGSAATATASVTWSTADIGTGNILRVDDERMVIRARTWVDSGQNLGGTGLAASMADVGVHVADGGAYGVDEVFQLDSERMLITSIAGDVLTVVRAWDGSVLAAHGAGVDVWTLTGVELDRGQLGTAAAVHESGAVIYRHVVPGLVDALCVAEAVNTLQQQGGGYGRTVGSGESRSIVGLSGLEAIRDDAFAGYGRVLWAGV